MAHRTDTRASLALSIGDPGGPYAGQRERGGDEEAVRHRENQRRHDRLTRYGVQCRAVLVARVLAKLEPGGAQLSVLRVARALAARGHRTRLLVGFATDPGVALARAHGVEPELMGAEEDLQWCCDPAFAAWLEPRLAGADLVHAHMLGAWWAAGRAVAPGIPFAASEHNDLLWPGEPQWGAMSEVAERVDRFYAHSPGARAGVLRVGVPEERVVRGVSPVEGFGAEERPGLPSPRIVFTGRLTCDKGADVLVEAIARMAAPPPVLVLGAGVLEPTLRSRIAEASLERVVRLGGWVADPAPWVAGASVQACPSRDEAFSQSAVLAMALGVPVVGTRVDGFPETLTAGRGLIVEPDDPAALASALEDTLSGRRTTDVVGARAWAQRYRTERVASQYERDYLELCRAVVA
jgi:glycosyltransferase involved in cell wall biosynthesis